MFEVIQRSLSRYTKIRLPAPHLKPASVLLPIFEKDGDIYILFTCRTEKVEHHKGQISFPGGMRDPKDSDALSTAIRETWEEVGIDPSTIQVLGELDDLLTVSGFRVTPFVGKLKYPFPVKICEDELSEVFSAPLSFFMNETNCRQECLIDSNGHKREFFVYQFQQYRIWGATASMINNFIQIVKSNGLGFSNSLL